MCKNAQNVLVIFVQNYFKKTIDKCAQIVYNMSASTNSARKEAKELTAGEKMRKLRGNRSQDEVAKALGISYSSYSKYERDERVPRDKMKKKIASFFKTNVVDIFFS